MLRLLMGLWCSIALQISCAIADELSSTSPDIRFQPIRDELFAKVNQGKIASIAVAVVQDRKILWAEAFGWADRARKIPATVTTRYGLASLGKSLTATAAMILVQKGRLSLDRTIESSLAPVTMQLYAGGGAPTLRQLLNMTGGVPHGALTYFGSGAPSEDQLMRLRAMTVFRPGKVFHYSNFSMAIVDRLIENVSRQPFDAYMAQQVFSPLGMRQAAVGTPAGFAEPAVRYDGNGEPIGPLSAMPRNSRGMNASVSDLLNYASFNLNAPFAFQIPILPSQVTNAMHTERSQLEGAHFALGWGSMDLGGGKRWVVSNGQDMGVQSCITLFRELRAAVVVLLNQTGSEGDEYCVRIADAVSPGFAKSAMAAAAAYEGRTIPFQSSPDWMGKWSGTVKTRTSDTAIALTIGSTGDIKISIDGQYATLLDEASLTGNMLTGAFLARLPLEESVDRYHRVELGLHRDGQSLSGFALVNFKSERGKFEIPTFITLNRN